MIDPARLELCKSAWPRLKEQSDVMPYLRFDASEDCACKVLDGVILPVRHKFWNVAFPPNSSTCKCHYEQVSDRRMQAKGWTVTHETMLPTTECVAAGYRRNFGKGR